MVVPSASPVRVALGRTIFRRAAAQTRPQVWKQVIRRGYASAEHAKKSSDLPWMIASVAITVPAATWLLGQGPTKKPHHEEHHEKEEGGEEEEEPKEAREAIKGETAPSKEHSGQEKSPTADVSSKPIDHVPEGNEGGAYKHDPEHGKGKKEEEGEDKDESKDEGEDNGKPEQRDESGKGEDTKDKKNHKGADAVTPKPADKADQKKSGNDKSDKSADDSSSDSDEGKDTPDTSGDERPKDKDGYELPGPNAPQQINWNSSSNKGPGEGQKGPRKPSETAGEKSSQKNFSGSQNPYLDDDEKSKKGEGLKETMKIHGTVDRDRPLR